MGRSIVVLQCCSWSKRDTRYALLFRQYTAYDRTIFNSPARAIVIYRESDLCAHLIGAVLTLDAMIVELSCNAVNFRGYLKKILIILMKVNQMAIKRNHYSPPSLLVIRIYSRIHTQQLGRLLSIESFLDEFILCIILYLNKETRGCAARAPTCISRVSLNP